MIPCKECILLALCSSKTNIECDLLHEWGTTHRDKWDNLKEYIKNYPNVRICTTPKVCKTGIKTEILDIKMSKDTRAMMKDLETSLKARFFGSC